MQVKDLERFIARIAPVIRVRLGVSPFSVAVFHEGALPSAKGFSVLNFEYKDDESLENAVAEASGTPDFVAVGDVGFFALGACKADADAKLEALFSGRAYSAPDSSHFEKGRMMGRVVLITGGAQGFGEGIGEELCKNGAHVVIADLQLEKAREVAARFDSLYGAGTAMAVLCDVTDEESVESAFLAAARAYGGVDAAISNAGIAGSGSLESMDVKRFDRLMAVNVRGYYLVSKYAARLMRPETKYDRQGLCRDIIQINSISGLGGYMNNFTYGASKFAGIGMTQCFALELVKSRIKVNAVCPGNFYDGPLWSDPEKGLFKLYFDDGKMPGAKNVKEAEQWYRTKDPFGRGCVPADVACSVMYCIEQQYDSGQAVGSTGALRMVK